MTNGLKQKLLAFFSLLFFGFYMVSAPLAYAEQLKVISPPSNNTSKSNICEGAGLVNDNGECKQPGSGPSVQGVVRTAIDILSIIVGLVAVIMVIVAGVKFVTSGGSSEKVTSAKNTILYAVIGLIIVAFAQIIVRFVLFKTGKST